MRPPRRNSESQTATIGRGRSARLAAALMVLATGLGVVVTLNALGGGPDPTVAGAFAAAWSRGDLAAAARLTDAPKATLAGLEANRAGLDGASVSVHVQSASGSS